MIKSRYTTVTRRAMLRSHGSPDQTTPTEPLRFETTRLGQFDNRLQIKIRYLFTYFCSSENTVSSKYTEYYTP